MSKILLYDDNEELFEAIQILLMTEFDIELIAVDNINDAIERLENHEGISVILSDFVFPGENVQKLINSNRKLNKLPILLFSNEDTEKCKREFTNSDNITFIKKPFTEKELFKSIQNTIKETITIPNTTLYRPVPTRFLRGRAFKDISFFVKLNEQHFVKFYENDGSLDQYIDDYKNKNVEQFYILKSDLPVFYNSIHDALDSYLKQSPNAEKEHINLIGFSFEVNYQSLKELGLKEIELSLAEKTIENSLKALQNNKKLSSILEKLDKTQGHLKNHSILSIYLSTTIAKRLSWNTPQLLEKLALISFFHDFGLGNPELSQYENQDFSKLDKESQEDIKTHTTIASKYFQTLPKFDDDVIKAIGEHHESPDGSGYPYGLNSNSISPIGCLFIISHDLANFLVQNDDNAGKAISYMTAKEEYYGRGNFKKAYKGLIDIIS